MAKKGTGACGGAPTNKRGNCLPYTKPGHNGATPTEPAKGSYKPNDPARAKKAKV